MSDSNLDVVTVLLSMAQIFGLLAIILLDGPIESVIAGIAGFAAIVNCFLPDRIGSSSFRWLKMASGICGAGLLVIVVGNCL